MWLKLRLFTEKYTGASESISQVCSCMDFQLNGVSSLELIQV